MALKRFAEYQQEDKPFLIDQYLSPYVNLVTGKAKSGKTALAGHMCRSLTLGEPFLGFSVDVRSHKIYWAGSDGGWRDELATRWRGTEWFSELLYEEGEEPRHWGREDWVGKGKELATEGVTVAVLDHLYGFSGGANLNHSHDVQPIFDGFRFWPDRYGISVILLAHAGKGGWDGSAAHSYAIEAETRQIVSIGGDGRSRGERTLTVSGNYVRPFTQTVKLSPFELSAVGEVDSKVKARSGRWPALARRLLDESPLEARASQAAAGRWLAATGEAKNDASGRSTVVKMVKGGLLLPGPDGNLVAGENLAVDVTGEPVNR